MAARIEKTNQRYPWLVDEEGGVVRGYAYASAHRVKAAYRWAVEVTIYLHPDHRGKGLGRALYAELFDRLRAQGLVKAYAGILIPNPASQAAPRVDGIHARRDLHEGGLQARGVAGRRLVAASPSSRRSTPRPSPPYPPHPTPHDEIRPPHPLPQLHRGRMDPPKLAGSPVFNPSTGDVIAECPMGGAAEVNAAVEAAAAAFPAWRDTPAIERARVLLPVPAPGRGELRPALRQRLAASTARRSSRPAAASTAGIENIEYACGVPSLLFGDTLENVARNVDCETVLQPLGVCAGITPFNFPAMVPLWMFPLAIACGNTFVLKPSEKVPLTALVLWPSSSRRPACPRASSTWSTAGRECVDALLAHPKVRAVSFVGSTPGREAHLRDGHEEREAGPGERRRQELHRRHARRRHAAARSRPCPAAAFGCAGERCMAGSTAIAVGRAARRA